MADRYAHPQLAHNKKIVKNGKLNLGKKVGSGEFVGSSGPTGPTRQILGKDLYRQKGSAYIWAEDKNGNMRRIRGSARKGPGKVPGTGYKRYKRAK